MNKYNELELLQKDVFEILTEISNKNPSLQFGIRVLESQVDIELYTSEFYQKAKKVFIDPNEDIEETIFWEACISEKGGRHYHVSLIECKECSHYSVEFNNGSIRRLPLRKQGTIKKYLEHLKRYF